MSMKRDNNLNDADKNKRTGQSNKPASKPLHLCRRLRLFLCNKCVKSGALIRMVGINLAGRNRLVGSVFRQINKQGLDVSVHKTRTMPNDKLTHPADGEGGAQKR